MAARSHAAPPRPGARTPSLSSLQHRASPVASIGDQIRQLELEGCVLRSQVDDILAEVGPTSREAGGGLAPSRPHSRARSRDHSRSPQLQRSSSVDAIMSSGQQQGQAGGNYSHLADSSAEQREIEEMSSRLEAQAAAAVHLQQSLRASSPGVGHQRGHLPRTEVLLPAASAERELREAQEQLQYARNQLRTAHDRQLREKAELRSQLDGLRARLHEALTSRDSTAAQRSREAEAQEELVARLQASLLSLQQANREQEQALLDTNERLDASKRHQFSVEAALADVRAVMADVEARRGRPFVAAQPVQHMDMAALPAVIDRCLQEYTSEIEDRMKDILTLERELSDSRQAFLQEREELERSWKRRVDEVKEELELEVRRAKDRALDEQRRADSLEGGARQQEEQLRQQLESRAGRVKELEAALAKVIDDYDGDRKTWESKRGGLEAALDEAQKELAATRAQRDETARSSALLETQVASLQQETAELKAEAEEQRRGREEAEAEGERDRQQLAANAEEAAELRALLRTLKEEADDITREQVGRALAEEKQVASSQVQAMSANVSRLGEQNELLAKELQAVRLDLSALESRQRALAEEKAAAEQRSAQADDECKRVQELLASRDAELRRLTEERDFYYAELADKSDRLAGVMSDYRHLVQLFEDKAAHLSALEQKQARSSELATEHLAAKQWALDEAKVGREAVVQRLRSRDKRLHEALQQRDRLQAEADRLRADVDRLQADKEALYLELKDSRLEVASLQQEAEAAKAGGRRDKESLEAKVSELSGRARDLKRQLTLAKDALKTKEALKPKEASAKPATVGGGKGGGGGGGGKRGQLDAANRQVKQLREQLADASQRMEKLEAENGRLAELGRQVQRQNEQLAEQLDSRGRQCREAANCARQLRAANEKLRGRLAAVAELDDAQRLLRDCRADDGGDGSGRSSPVEDLLTGGRSGAGHRLSETSERLLRNLSPQLPEKLAERPAAHRRLDEKLQQLTELGSQLRRDAQSTAEQVQQQAERLQAQ